MCGFVGVGVGACAGTVSLRVRVHERVRERVRERPRARHSAPGEGTSGEGRHSRFPQQGRCQHARLVRALKEGEWSRLQAGPSELGTLGHVGRVYRGPWRAQRPQSVVPLSPAPQALNAD